MKLKHLNLFVNCPTTLSKNGYIRTLVSAFFLVSAPVFALAQDDGGAQINPALAQEAVRQLLPAIPVDVGLAQEDYISGNDYTEDTRRVRVQIGPDGSMMPSEDWQNSHPAHCRKQARETNSAAQLLTFELIRTTETLDGLTRHQYYATLRTIDAGSGIVDKIGRGESTVGQLSAGSEGVMENPDAEGLEQALNIAMQNVGVNIGTPNDGCGDIRLTHQFGTKVDEVFGFVAGYQNESAPNVTYEWDFGDGAGTGSGGQLGRHNYAQKGTYTVTVHVSGEGVRAGSASITVAVKEEEPIQPRDGSWTINMIDHQMRGCSPKITEGVESAMSAMVGNSSLETLTFQNPFHPEPLMKHADNMVWEQTGTNTWKTVLADQGSNDMSHRVVLDLEVVSPILMKEVLNHHITMSETMVNIMGGTTNCVATGFFDVDFEQ